MAVVGVMCDDLFAGCRRNFSLEPVTRFLSGLALCLAGFGSSDLDLQTTVDSQCRRGDQVIVFVKRPLTNRRILLVPIPTCHLWGDWPGDENAEGVAAHALVRPVLVVYH